MGGMTNTEDEETKESQVKEPMDEMNVDQVEENGSNSVTLKAQVGNMDCPDGDANQSVELATEALELDLEAATVPPVTEVQAICKKRKLTIDEDDDGGNTYERLGLEINKANERLVEFLISGTKVIDTLEEGKQVIDEIMASKATVSVDCEGVNLGDRRSGKVTLVQVGVVQGVQAKALLFDVQVEPKLAKELERLLESEDIVKVMHDCRADSEGLHHQFGIQIRSIFDTQSAHIVIRQKSPDFSSADKQIGLDKVCVAYGGLPNQFKDTVKGLYRRDQRIWSRRPLTELLISYAASDVLCLVPTVYNEMSKQISSEEDRKLMLDLSNKQISHTRDKSSHSRPVNSSRHQQHHRHHHYQPRRGRGRPYY